MFATLQGKVIFFAYALRTMSLIAGVCFVLLIALSIVRARWPHLPDTAKQVRMDEDAWARSPSGVRVFAAVAGVFERFCHLLAGALFAMLFVATTIKIVMR
jgi:hypothetical protein